MSAYPNPSISGSTAPPVQVLLINLYYWICASIGCDKTADAAQRWADHGKLLKISKGLPMSEGDYLGKGEHDVVDNFLSTEINGRPVSCET
jgi:hypothetical protein